MNRLFLITLLSALAAAFSEEMIKGAQTGAFIASEENMKVYQCPEVHIPDFAQTFLNMIEPMEMAFIQLTNQLTGDTSEKPKTCEECKDNFRQMAVIYFLVKGDYEGSDFCQGLILAHSFR